MFDARLAGLVICADGQHFDVLLLFFFFLPGDLENNNKNDNIHKMHVPKDQGLVFPGNKSACGRHIDHRVVGACTP